MRQLHTKLTVPPSTQDVLRRGGGWADQQLPDGTDIFLRHRIGRGDENSFYLRQSLDLGTNFGLSPLIGKPLAIISDARLGDTPSHTVVERLLSITGEDMLTVDRKFREPWSGKLPARFTILSNELPKFKDSSGAIANRLLICRSPSRSWGARIAPLMSVSAPSCPASSRGRWRV